MNKSIISHINSTQPECTITKLTNCDRHSYYMVKTPRPVFYIGGYNGGGIVDSILTKRGWKRTYDTSTDDFTLKWTENLSQINFYRLKPNCHLVNHIPNCGIITNKLGLLLSLRNYEKYCENIDQFRIDQFVPKTFIIDDLNERSEFFSTFKNGDIWINKPTGSNQGKGITLMRDIDRFRADLLERDYLRQSLMWGFDTRIVQKYITNPLLIEGRKFDIRCFMLIGSTLPYLILFHPGYIRLSMNQYSNKDDDLITHLTNQFVQKQSPKFEDLKEDTIWTIQKFNQYFNDFYRNHNNFKYDWVITDLMDNLKSITLHVFKAVKHRLANSTSYFEIYGFDFLIDDSLKVWLIEANSNPSMSLSCSILKEIIPPLLEETLLIALECFQKNMKINRELLPLENAKTFQIIYSENPEFSRSRKSVHNAFRLWTAPRYSPYISDSKSFSEGPRFQKSSFSYNPGLSSSSKRSHVDDMMQQWKANIKKEKKLKNVQKNKDDLSGDAKSLSRSFQVIRPLLSGYASPHRNVNSKLVHINMRNKINENLSLTLTQDKLKSIIRNME